MIDALKTAAATAAAAAPAGLDLTDADHLDRTLQAADSLLAVGAPPPALRALEEALVADPRTPLLVHLAAKLALSRTLLRGLPAPVHVSVVFAVYREHLRIRPPAEVAGGEDFLVRKVSQLEWLGRDVPGFGWDLVIVDDGCPEDSGGLAAAIAGRHSWRDRVRVLRLAEAIAADLPVTRPLRDTSGSMKGGAIALGLQAAADTERPGHVVVFTDADLSTHLGQVGLLLDPLVAGGFDAAVGSRRESLSVVIKQGARNDRGKLFIYLWKRLIDVLPDIVDTQCGFKAFPAEVARDITVDLLEKKFAFDVELLIRTRQRGRGRIARVPIAWIDSDVLSTTTDLQPYLPMLQAMTAMQRRYLEPDAEARAFAAFIDELDEEAWQRLLAAIPAGIANGDPTEFGTWNGVGVEELRRAAGL